MISIIDYTLHQLLKIRGKKEEIQYNKIMILKSKDLSTPKQVRDNINGMIKRLQQRSKISCSTSSCSSSSPWQVVILIKLLHSYLSQWWSCISCKFFRKRKFFSFRTKVLLTTFCCSFFSPSFCWNRCVQLRYETFFFFSLFSICSLFTIYNNFSKKARHLINDFRATFR